MTLSAFAPLGYGIQWLKYDVRRAIAPERFKLIADLAIAGQGQALERLSVDDYGRVV